MPDRKLFKNGCVLSLDSKVGNFMHADVLIDGSKIAAVGPNLSAGDAEIIDAANMIVMPGFVDTHRHIWEGILRNIGTDWPLTGGEVSYEKIILNTLAPVYRPEDVYAGNRIGILGAIDAGITCILDWANIQQTREHGEAGIRALNDSGIRAVYAFGGPSGIEPDAKLEQWFRDIAQKHFSSKDQLLTLGHAALGPDDSLLDVVKRDWQLARELDARISIHVGVGAWGRNGKLADMGRAGLLKDDTTYIHCATLNDEEIGMIVDTGGTVSLAAPVEMMMGHGQVPTQKFLNRGLRPSLSVDVETNVPGDMFTQMRSVASLQRALIFDQKLNGSRSQPDFLNARDVLEFATVEGARANGLLHKIGTLTPGKEADIVMLKMNMINVMPVNDPIGAVVWGMDTSNVDSVFVAGKALKRGGKLLNVDLKDVRKMVTDSRDYVLKTAGYALPQI